MMSLVRGGVLSSYLKQKFNLKSYNEVDIVGAHNGLGVVLWIKNFLKY